MSAAIGKEFTIYFHSYDWRAAILDTSGKHGMKQNFAFPPCVLRRVS